MTINTERIPLLDEISGCGLDDLPGIEPLPALNIPRRPQNIDLTIAPSRQVVLHAAVAKSVVNPIFDTVFSDVQNTATPRLT